MASVGSKKGRQIYANGKSFKALNSLASLELPEINQVTLNWTYNIKKPYDIKKVIFNYPATIVLWEDGTKTVVKCQEGDCFDKEKGLAMAIAKKFMGNKSNFNNKIKKWVNDD